MRERADAPPAPPGPKAGGASGRRSLALRILLVNLVALVGFAIGVFYLDSYRERLLATRQAEMVAQGQIIAHLLAGEPGREAERIARLALPRGTRVRLYGPDGALLADNWRDPAMPRFVLEDPTTAGFRRQSARTLDRFIEIASFGARLPLWEEPAVDRLESWPEARAAARSGEPQSSARRTADGAVVLFAAVPQRSPQAEIPSASGAILLMANAGDLVEQVRQEREQTFKLFLALLAASLLLSVYLARTIVRPLGELALAASRVRRGRDRDVEIPRYPGRRDEIGRLARALADMTAALRQRIDATESFAADVAHELKNPLASLRSAVEALGSVRRSEDRDRLFALIAADVERIDRLILDISAASRLDAELTRIEPALVDLGVFVRDMARALMLVPPWSGRLRLVVDAPLEGEALAMAERGRLEQVLANLLDNAASFSPEGGTVRITLACSAGRVRLSVEDEGPGVDPRYAETIFERFYTERPEGESYGTHSGLGLSIARSIVEAFDGRLFVTARPDGRRGACFVVELPHASRAAAGPPGKGARAAASGLGVAA
ncbi:sensor histidine kinase [Thermaurantiacus tibetensis]|uniref:sensor histidine kinase n=1 Tax=Thermaurantiacus tibetensis TaxID=2759035 RepID=UPI00188FDDF2|nr:stimulus-sensing domain-containing protein [Thermaurantiacus tibetensis]